MGRLVMDSGFRRIKKAAPVEAEPVDPRLALVDLFVSGHAAPEGFVDLSQHDGPDLSDLFIEDAQEPAEQPVADTGADGPVEAPTAVDEAPAQPEPEEKTEDPEPVAAEDDYDPIAAVLG
jgi:hypothetical protein